MDEQILQGGGVLALIATLWKLALPFLSEKLGVGSRETKLLGEIKEGQRIAAEVARLEAVERRQHYKQLDRCIEKLDYLERMRSNAHSD